MASLAALLIVVAYNMAELKHFRQILRVAPRSDVFVLLICFSLTVVFDMVIGVSAGVLLAAMMYLWRIVSPEMVASVFRPIYSFLANRWYFDEFYNAIFVRPVFAVASLASGTDRGVIDRLIDGIAWSARQLAGFDAWIDRNLVDGLVNATATATWNAGLELKKLQTGRLRQYVMFIVVGTVALFVLASMLFRAALAF
jgi:NADH:ubiquinone oxidoreductase subunit 5 (subunit L)/multisubunit Na+/H+ antiporter MnhA subunit